MSIRIPAFLIGSASLVVWNLEKATPILRSRTCLASTDIASLKLGSALRPSNALTISFLAIDENLALKTLWTLLDDLGMNYLQMSSTSKQIFSPSLSQSSQRTMKSRFLATICKSFATGRLLGSHFFTVGASNRMAGSLVLF